MRPNTPPPEDDCPLWQILRRMKLALGVLWLIVRLLRELFA
jgi:hypothetical protein